MILKLDHVQIAIPAGGEPEARRFYTEGLGLVEVPKPAHLAARGGLWFASGEVKLHLGVDTDFRPARKAHPALVVGDLAATRRRLEELGFEFTDDEPLPGYERTYVSDPFGNRVEIMQEIGSE